MCTSKYFCDIIGYSAKRLLDRSDLSVPPVPSFGTAQVLVASDGGAFAMITRLPVAKCNKSRGLIKPVSCSFRLH